MESPHHKKSNYDGQNSRCGLTPGGWAGKKRFRLKRLIGSGGMGEVWLAYDTRLKEFVALKFLLPQIANNIKDIEHLRLETHRSRKLSHPNIVRIYDLYEETGEIPFISMEYVNGPNLHQVRLIRTNGVLRWDFLSPLLRQLISALEYAHNENIIHRDIKPSNLLIDNQNRLKLADFGIARLVHRGELARRGPGFGGGTLDFISPQQASGMPATFSDDIYSIGATLYELLTSTPPFYKGDIEYQIYNTKPDPLRERLLESGIHNPIPPALEDFIQLCLDKEPNNRPTDYAEILNWINLIDEQFANFENQQPEKESITTNLSESSRSSKVIEKNKTDQSKYEEKVPTVKLSDLIKIGIGILLLGFAGGIIFVMATHRVFNITGDVKESDKLSPKISQIKRQTSDNIDKSNQIKIREAEGEKAQQTVQSKTNITKEKAIAQKPQTSPSKITPSTTENLTGRLIRQFSKGLNTLISTPDSVWTIAADSDGWLRMVDLRNGSIVWEEKTVRGEITTLAISPNGRQFLTGDSNGSLILWNIAGFEKLVFWQNHQTSITAAAFSPLRYAASGDASGIVNLWDTFSGRFLSDIKTRVGAISQLLFLPDKPALVSSSDMGVINIYSLPSGRTEISTQAHRNKIVGIGYNQIDKRLFSADVDGIIKAFDINGLKEIKQINQRISSRESFNLMRLSPDGKIIAIISSLNFLYLFDSSTLNQIKKSQLHIHNGKVTDAWWSPDKMSLITVGNDGSICMWDLSNMQ